MHRLGFIGTGTITAAIVRGLKGSDLASWPVVLSPRSTNLSAELASSLPGVTVAASNQAVVEHSDVVVLAVRPQDAREALQSLHFRADQRVISLVAALDIDTIRQWTGASSVTRAIPLTFVEQRVGVTPVMPPDATAATIFRALGGCIEVADPSAFDAYAAASALMGTYFGFIEAAQDWLVANGLKESDAGLYLRNLFGSLGDVLRERPLSLSELRAAHSTKGGLNEHVFLRFIKAGGGSALGDGLTSVQARIQGRI